MKLRLNLLIAILGFCASQSACKNDTPTEAPEPIGAPTNVVARAIDSATVFVQWQRASNDKGADTVIVLIQAGIADRAIVNPPDTSATIHALHSGTQYTVIVSSKDKAALPVSVTTPIPPKPVKVVSNLQATSLSATSIGLRWTRDAGDTGNDTLIVVASGLQTGNIPLASPQSSVAVTGLNIGTVYTFTVRNAGGASTQLSWMTAERFGPVRIYEWSSSFPSGLSLRTGTSISAVQANRSSIDFLLDDVQNDPSITSPSGLAFEGTQLFDATWRSSYINVDSNYAQGGLDNFYSTDFSSFMSKVQASPSVLGNEYDPPAVASTRGSRILTVETADGNLAKIEVIPQPTGLFYGGTAPNRYIELNISYNPTASMPYASRPRSHLHERRIPVY